MITVVIPVHNREQLIRRAIISALSQTLPVDEIIVVDDASTDGTTEVVHELSKSNNNLTLIALKENVGASRARNIAIEAAKGDLVAFLDSDDVWHVDKLSKQVNEIRKHKDVVAVFCGIVAITPDAKVRHHIVPKPTVTLDDLCHSNLLMTMSCALILKSALVKIGGFDEALPTCEDWDLFIRLADIGKISVVQEALVEQFMHQGHRLSRDARRVLMGHDALYKKIYSRISDRKMLREIRASYEIRMADIFSTDYCFRPLRAILHSCKSILMNPSREGLHSFRRVIKSLYGLILTR